MELFKQTHHVQAGPVPICFVIGGNVGLGFDRDLLLQARTYGQAPKIDGLTYINEGWAEPGSIVRAEIVDAGDYDLVARII